MKMKMADGMLYIAGSDSSQYAIIKSWNLMRWNKSMQWLEGPCTGELLNRLASIVRLPEQIEAERRKFNDLTKAVDAERLKEEPVPLYSYPVKIPLFKHQIRGCNMAMIVFGLVDPKEVEEKKWENGKKTSS